MAGDDKKATTTPAAKNEAPAEKSPAEKKKSTSDATPSKAESGETAGATPSGYSRGEGQKPVTKAYKDNWNLIFGKKKKR
jgi:hypothetical protein